MSLRFFCATLVVAGFGLPAAAELPGAPQPVTGSLLDTPQLALEGRWSVVMAHGADSSDTGGDSANGGRGDETKLSKETLVITSASDGGLQGGFMGAPFGESATRKDGGSIVFFTTTQASGNPVYHSGRITKGLLSGQSYFTGRKELLLWRGTREAEQE